MANGQKRSGVMDVVGLVASLSVVAGPLLAWLRLVPAIVGFYLFLLGGIVAIVASLSALISTARGRGFGFGRAMALLAALAFLFAAFRTGDASMINDYTTSLEDPPSFAYAGSLPANAGRDLAYPAAFADTQRTCCADLRTARVAASPVEALQRAERVAAAMPNWTVTKVDPGAGTVAAVAESVLFGFEDDIVIRVRPDGTASVVDVRSKSRQGRGDMGANAARIRGYVTALEAGAPAVS